MPEKTTGLCKVLMIIVVILCFCLLVAVLDAEPLTPQPLDELNPKVRYVIISDDAGNHVKLDKTYIKTIHVEGSYIYINHGNHDVRILVYSNTTRRREMCDRLLRWWKAG